MHALRIDSSLMRLACSRPAPLLPGETHLVAIEGADHNDRVLLDGAQLIGATVELADQVRLAL
jgi:hypothetical protein